MKPRRATSFFLLTLALLAFSLSACRFSGSSSEGDRRISDAPIIPGYVVSPGGVEVIRDPADLTRLKFSAPAGSYGYLGGQPAALRIAVFSVGEEWITSVANASGPQPVDGELVGEIVSEADGSVSPTTLLFTENRGYLLLYVFDQAGGSSPRPSQIQAPDSTAIVAPVSDVGVGYFWNLFPMKSLGLWTTPEEVLALDQKKVGFTYIVNRARWKPHWENNFDLGNNLMAADSAILAAAVAYTANPAKYPELKKAVIDGIGQLLGMGQPVGNVVAMAGNIVGFVMAADLIGYRTAAFDNYLRNLSRVWKFPVGNTERTMLGMWWAYAHQQQGMQTLLALVNIYAYLGEKPQLQAVLTQWKTLLGGTPWTKLNWLATPWQADPAKKYFINPLGATVLCNGSPLDIGGTMPQFMASSDPCTGELAKGWDALKSIEMMVSVARVAERQGYPLWGAGHHAIKRAITAMSFYKLPVKAYPAMAWMLKFVDKRYGTNFSCALGEMPSAYEWVGGSIGMTWLEGDIPRTCPKP